MRRAGFTLVELILVLAILAVMVAFVAPVLAKSSRSRTLEQEALKLLAVTEYARDEAVSQGVAFAVFVDSNAGTFGMEPATTESGVTIRKDFTLPDELHFEPIPTTSENAQQNRVMTFTPEGVPDSASIDAITLADRSGEWRSVKKQDDGYAYGIVKEETQ